MKCQSKSRRGFTLIELLVVISIIALLLVILLPALGAAKDSAAQIAESSAQKQSLVGYEIHSIDNKGILLEGYSNTAIARDRDGVLYAAAAEAVAKRYPWRLAPSLDYQLGGSLYVGDTLEKWEDPSAGAYALSVSPAFGLNARYLGGDFRFSFLPYLKRSEQASDPSGLIVFGTARQATGSPGSHSAGFYEIYQPSVAAFELDNQASGVFGNLFPRWNGRTNMGMLDGHVETMDQEQVQDARYWSNAARVANDPNWTPN